METDYIHSRIPHRPPFLWLDRVLEVREDALLAEKVVPVDLELFRGHYPDHPIMPGVLLCEAVFQAGALLISEQLGRNGDRNTGVPVLTRIQGARFKREVGPGDRIEIHVRLRERLGPAWFLKGSVRVHGRVAVTVEFGCTLKAEE